eukprot:scaffold1609_cov91-Cylindrotheca_fusiformis.AAC.1
MAIGSTSAFITVSKYNPILLPHGRVIASSHPSSSFKMPSTDRETSHLILSGGGSSTIRDRSKTHQLSERREDESGGGVGGGYKGTNDGTGRGLILQGIILGICIWLFTIPPEFRRAYFCPADIYCQEVGSCTKECFTYGQWFQQVGDYYKNGGGIQWDFSIDPRTKQANQEKWDALFGKQKET